jgi:hypothetical protein
MTVADVVVGAVTAPIDPPDEPIVIVPPADAPSWVENLFDVISGLGQRVTNLEGIMGEVRTGIQSLQGTLNDIAAGVQAAPATMANTMTATMVGTMQFDVTGFTTLPSLAQVFPFSIPFDLYNALAGLVRPGYAPRFEIDFTDTVFGGGKFVLDFAEFEGLAAIVRWGLFLSFVIGLMLSTKTLIQW